MGIYEPKREDQVFANVIGHNAGPLPNDAVKRIFERIIDEMRTVQKLKIVAEGLQVLVVMQEDATIAQTEAVIGRLVEMGFTVHRSTGVRHTVLGAWGRWTISIRRSWKFSKALKNATALFRPTNSRAGASSRRARS